MFELKKKMKFKTEKPCRKAAEGPPHGLDGAGGGEREDRGEGAVVSRPAHLRPPADCLRRVGEVFERRSFGIKAFPGPAVATLDPT